MKGIAARSAKLLALAGLLFAVTASSSSAASRTRAPILGVVPHKAQSAAAPRLLSLSSVLRAAGPTALTFDASYQNVINQYFTDIAHDSGGAGNVYSVATQYYDNPGPAHVQYQSAFGGSYVDRNPLPANGCSDGADPYCLTDAQLTTEIQNAMTAMGWHGGLDHVFFLMTPNGVGSCFDANGGECSTNAFCAYHSAFLDSDNQDAVYANEPYLGPYPGCTDASQGYPSDIDSDTTINTISHEHNEAITDPLGTAWLSNDTNQDENGDLCAYGFGAALGGTAGIDAYNQVINGHRYDLQQEFSNVDGGCIQHTGGTPVAPPTNGSGPLVYHGGPVMHTATTYAIYWLPTARNSTPPVVTGAAGVNQTLTTSGGAWAGGASVSSYQWQRCSASGTSCVDIPGATATTFTLTTADVGHVVRSTVRATNVNGLSPPAASAGTAVVVDVPVSSKAPHVSGHTHVGRKLSVSHGSWTYHASYGYRWLRCNAHGGSCSSIRNATRSTYKLTTHDAGHTLRVRVTATNAAGSAAVTSAASGRIRH
jgi:hypothetical protein